MRKDLREKSSNDYFVPQGLYFVLEGKKRQGCQRLFLFFVYVCVSVHPNVTKYRYRLCSLLLTKENSFQETVQIEFMNLLFPSQIRFIFSDSLVSLGKHFIFNRQTEPVSEGCL